MVYRLLISALVITLTLLPRVSVFAQSAPDFNLPLLAQSDAGGSQLWQSGSLRLSDLTGKEVYLDFWASWCAPCALSLPELETLYARFKSRGFEVVAINLDTTESAARRFLQDKAITYPILFDQRQTTPERYGVAGMPTAFLLDHSGKLRFTHTGFKPSDTEKLSKLIQQLLQEKERL